MESRIGDYERVQLSLDDEFSSFGFGPLSIWFQEYH